MQAFREFQYPESQAFLPRKKFKDWWNARIVNNPKLQTIEIPTNVDAAIQHTKELKVPRKIHVWVNRKYPEIIKMEW
jgi:hypothetical protein